MKKIQKMLMNPFTGSVDTEENWLLDSKTWEKSDGKTVKEQLASLVEVEFIKNEWREKLK